MTLSGLKPVLIHMTIVTVVYCENVKKTCTTPPLKGSSVEITFIPQFLIFYYPICIWIQKSSPVFMMRLQHLDLKELNQCTEIMPKNIF